MKEGVLHNKNNVSMEIFRKIFICAKENRSENIDDLLFGCLTKSDKMLEKVFGKSVIFVENDSFMIAVVVEGKCSL